MNKFVLFVLMALAASCGMASAKTETLDKGCKKLREHVSKWMEGVKKEIPPCYKIMVTKVYPVDGAVGGLTSLGGLGGLGGAVSDLSGLAGLGNDPKEMVEKLINVHRVTPMKEQMDCLAKSTKNIESMAKSFEKMVRAIPSQVDDKCKKAVQGLMGEMKKGIGGNYF